MAEDGKLLSEEEMSAIELVSSGALEGEGYNLSQEYKPLDLLAEDTTGSGINMRSLEQISELFHRNFRTGMLETLRYNARFEGHGNLYELWPLHTAVTSNCVCYPVCHPFVTMCCV